MANGCGCESGLLRWVRPPYRHIFYAACCKHDDLYDIGGNSEDRHLADRQLYSDMMKRTYCLEQRPLRMWWMVTVALVYYAAVRIFGRFYFNFKQ